MNLDSLEPQEVLRHLMEVKARIDELEDEKQTLSLYLEQFKPEDLYTEYDGKRYRATVSRSVSTKVNLHRLAAINPYLFSEVTKAVVDTEKLKQTLDAGLWTETMRDECVTFSTSRPAVRFTPVSDQVMAE